MKKFFTIVFIFIVCLTGIPGARMLRTSAQQFRTSDRQSRASAQILRAEAFRPYIESFNAGDEELYPQYITNARSWEFLSKNIPLLDCPDRQLEQTYYFRWWTYAKHIRKTPVGFVILEFLPDVSWAGKYNTINCAAALHVYEGRWLHDPRYINDYIRFWYRGGGDMKAYSCWMADALWQQFLVTGDTAGTIGLEKDLIRNYLGWEKDKLNSNGLYEQLGGNDGMEVSICGGVEEEQPGYRATLNSYTIADARAIANIAALAGHKEVADEFRQKAAILRDNLQNLLWDSAASFFKVMPKAGPDLKTDPVSGLRSDSGSVVSPLTAGGRPRPALCSARELHGYTPWLFNIPSERYSSAWKFLMDPHYFYAPYGPTTAEQKDPGFQVSYEGHECQWDGPSWPFATSVTLTGLANLLNNYSQDYISQKDYFKLLLLYARSQQRKKADGTIVPWIDEDLNPFTGDWISRTRLSTWDNGHWSAAKGGVERGKDYNHSTFCDMVISGLIGFRPAAGHSFTVNPLIPEGTWDYFCLDNLLYRGRTLTIFYDRTGTHYHRGQGLMVWIDGKLTASAPALQKVQVTM